MVLERQVMSRKQWKKRQRKAIIPTDPYTLQERVDHIIRYTLQLFAAAWIGLEVAIPPNPYKIHLVTVLVLLICHKYRIPSKVIDTWERLWHSKG